MKSTNTSFNISSKKVPEIMQENFVKDHTLKCSGSGVKETSHKFDMLRLMEDIRYSISTGFVTLKKGQNEKVVAKKKFIERISFSLKGLEEDLSGIFEYFNGNVSEDNRHLIHNDSQYFEKKYESVKKAILEDVSAKFSDLFEKVGKLENVVNGKNETQHSTGKQNIEALLCEEEYADIYPFLNGFVQKNYSKINDAPFCFYQSALRAELVLLSDQFQFLEKSFKDEEGNLLGDSFIKKNLQEGNKFSIILQDKQSSFQQGYKRLMRYPTQAVGEQFDALYSGLEMNAALLDPSVKQFKSSLKDSGVLDDIISKEQFDILSDIEKALQKDGEVLKVKIVEGSGKNHLLKTLIPQLFKEKKENKPGQDIDDLMGGDDISLRYVHFISKKEDLENIKSQKSFKGEVFVIDEGIEVEDVDSFKDKGAVVVMLSHKVKKAKIEPIQEYHRVDFDLFADGNEAIFMPKPEVKGLNEIDMFLAYYKGGEDHLYAVVKNLIPQPQEFDKMVYIMPDFLIDEKSCDAANLRPLFEQTKVNIIALPHKNPNGSQGIKIAYGANGEFQKVIFSGGALGVKQIIKNVFRILKKQGITAPRSICFYDATNVDNGDYDSLSSDVNSRYVHFTDIICLAREENPVSWEMLMNFFGFDDVINEVEQKIIFSEIAQEGEDENYVHEFDGQNRELVVKRIDENSRK